MLLQNVRRARLLRTLDGLRTRRIAPPHALTCKGKTDGPGAQLHAQLSVIAFCRAAGLKYTHSPLREAEHTTSAAQVAAWENFLNLSDFADAAPEADLPEAELLEYASGCGNMGHRVVATAKHLHAYLDTYPQYYEPLQPKLRKNAFRACAKGLPTPAKIAIHMRRGDVGPDSAPFRYTPNEDVVSHLRFLHERHPDISGSKGAVRLYSQGEEADFAEIARAFPDLELHLDTDPIETIRDLANAQNLVMAKSSFSFVAALLCSGRVFYEPFWHAPLAGWTRLK